MVCAVGVILRHLLDGDCIDVSPSCCLFVVLACKFALDSGILSDIKIFWNCSTKAGSDQEGKTQQVRR
jgi:hypothetical protein